MQFPIDQYFGYVRKTSQKDLRKYTLYPQKNGLRSYQRICSRSL